MKRLAALLMALSCSALLAASAFRFSSESPLSIAVSPDATPAEKTAAEELHDYLRKLCGAECRITNENDSQNPSIYLGWTEAAKKSVGDLSRLGEEEWVVKTDNGSLIITGGRPRGTLYAVYEFLEGQGVVWPDETTEYVPSLKEIRFDAPVSIQGRPAFLGRHIYSGHHWPSKAATLFYVRNKMNHPNVLPAEYGYGFSIGKPGGCHTFHPYSQPDWPDEWFMQDKNGKRLRSVNHGGPGQLCLTNPELRKAMVERLRQFIAEDRKGKPAESWPRIYDISHNDNSNHCLCPECSALAEREGSYSGPMLDFVNYIANAIADEHPEILIQTFAYTWTLDVPKTIRPAKNVLIRVCKLGSEFFPGGKSDTQLPNTHPRNKIYYDNFLQWAKIADNLAIWDYWIIYRKGQFSLPYINHAQIQQDMRLYRDNNVKTIFAETEKPLVTSFAYFKYWFGLKMMQNPDAPFEELAQRFFNAYYGNAATPMKYLAEYIQRREAESDAFMARSPMATRIAMPSDSSVAIPPSLPYLDREFFAKANVILDEAERRAANDAAALEHVRKERLPIDIALLGSPFCFDGALPCGKLIEKTPKAVFERVSSNIKQQARKFHDSDIYIRNSKALVKYEKELSQISRFVELGRDAIPEQFRDRKCVLLKSSSGFGEIVHDDDAPSSAPLRVAPQNRPEFHKLPASLGIYDFHSSSYLLKKELGANDIQQDGKFHWYHLGKTRLKKNCIMWAHWSWALQMPIDNLTIGDEDAREWDVYASLKFTGKPYVKGSEEEGNVLFDAVILAK